MIHRHNSKAAGRLGRKAERLASRWLQSRGLRLVERNWRQPFGEIDLILLDGTTLVFVEIKYRRDQQWMPAIESIAPGQQRRIARVGACYLQQQGDRLSYQDCRFDVVLLLGPWPKPRIEWIRGAFTADLGDAGSW